MAMVRRLSSPLSKARRLAGRSPSDGIWFVSSAVATQMADAGYLTIDGIAEEDEASFISATGLDEVTAKGVYAAAQAVAKLMAGEEAVDA